jgi:hypothetical protein
MRRPASYTSWDNKINEGILGKLKIKAVIDYIQNYQRRWKEHAKIMNTGKVKLKLFLCFN